RRRHTRCLSDWSSDVCSSDLSFARDRWAAGVSLGIPFGSGISWPATWPGRHEIVATDLKGFRAAPFVAYRVGKLRVSAGAHVDRSEERRVGKECRARWGPQAG